MFTIKDIENVYKKIQPNIAKTQLMYAEKLSALCGNKVWLKMENFQKTGSFKIRGALNKIGKLSAAEKAKGLIAASAGNHAQGVAFAASLEGIKALIYMPKTAPIAKIQATQNYGAEVVLYGQSFDETLEKAKEVALEKDLTFVHAFDDIEVIKGQATIAYEIWEEMQEIDYVLVPIGGGGLLSGVATYFKQVNPKIEIIGVEAANMNSYQQALAHDGPVHIHGQPSIADGIAVKKVSQLTYDLMKKNVDHVCTVTEEEIAQSVLYLLEKCKLVAEGSGAVTVAALLFDKIKIQNKNVVALISGGNIDITMVDRVINHGLISSNRRIVLYIDSLNNNNALIDLIGIVNQYNGSVFKIKSTTDQKRLNLNKVNFTFIIDVVNDKDASLIIQSMKNAGYVVRN